MVGPFDREKNSKNEPVGEGRYTWSDGSSYVGGVIGGLRNGHGIFTSADGTLVREESCCSRLQGRIDRVRGFIAMNGHIWLGVAMPTDPFDGQHGGQISSP